MIRPLTEDLICSAVDSIRALDRAILDTGGLPRGTVLSIQMVRQEVAMPDGSTARLGDLLVRIRPADLGRARPWTWLVRNDGVEGTREWIGALTRSVRTAATSQREAECPTN